MYIYIFIYYIYYIYYIYIKTSNKTRCMYDQAKPTVRELNPDHINPYVGTNDLNTEKTASQISKSI